MIHNVFPVFGCVWSKVAETDKLRFGATPFHHKRTNSGDETALRTMYNDLAFGGTVHEKWERA